MTAPPARNDIGGTGNPSRATAKAAFTALYDYLVERLGGTGATATAPEQDTACAALGAVRKTGDTMTGNLNVPSLNGGQLAGFRNLLINGGMQINQRAATTVADDTYCLDRWYVLSETGNVTVAQQTDQENGTPFNIRLTQPDVGAKQMGLAQIIEASNSKPLRGRAATLSARIRCSAAVQLNYAVLEWTGTADVVTSDVVSAWAASPTYVAGITERAKGTITPAANTWTNAPGLNAAISGATNNLIVFIWSNADLAQNVTLDISRVQLEPGSVATPFEYRDLGLESAFCQRYLPSVKADGISSVHFGTCALYQLGSFTAVLPFTVEARVPPTGVLLSNLAHISVGVLSTTTCSTLSFLNSTRVAGSILGTVVAAFPTINAQALFFNNANASIFFTGCEL